MISLFQNIAVGVALALAVPLVLAASDTELRAAMIFNIARFVQWPATSVQADHFEICTFGDNAVTEALNALAGKALNGASTSVRPVQQHDLSGCQLLYIAEERIEHMNIITETLTNSGTATLTISDAPSFLALGGMVQLVILNNRQRFRINQELAEKAKLGINAKLLQLALPGID